MIDEWHYQRAAKYSPRSLQAWMASLNTPLASPEGMAHAGCVVIVVCRCSSESAVLSLLPVLFLYSCCEGGVDVIPVGPVSEWGEKVWIRRRKE